MAGKETELLSASGTKFSSLADGLVQFLAGSEEIFLGVGARLQGLERKTLALLEVAQRAVTSGEDGFSGEVTKRLLAGVKLLEAEKVARQATSDEGTRVLKAVGEGIGQVVKLRDVFKNITSTLRSLASSTEIENTRTGMRGIGFDTVARDVREMAMAMAPKLDEVLQQGRRVQQTADQALAGIRTFSAATGKASQRSQADAYAGLDAVDRLAGGARGIAQEALNDAGKCQANIGKVQLSLQVHDIVRQMIEHVEQGFREFTTDAREAADRDGLCVEDWMGEVVELCRLEGAQLQGARGKLVSGIADIERNLQAIAQTVERLTTEVGELGGAGRGDSLLATLESEIRRMTSDLRGQVQREGALMASLGAVVESVNTMEDRVFEVVDIGNAARIIGLNAMVKAGNAGREGLTLTVLARSIQEVAETIEAMSKNALVLMGEVGDAAHRLVTARNQKNADAGDVESIVANLDELLAQLRGYHEGLAGGLAALERGSGDLQQEVSEISRSLASLMERTTLLEALERELEALADQARGVAGPDPKKWRPVREKSHQRRYTMAAERATLDRLAGQGAAQGSGESAELGLAEGSVEFF